MWVKGIIVRRLGKVMYLIKDCINLECVKRHKNQMVLYKGTSNSLLDNEQRDTYLPEPNITPAQSPLRSPPFMSPSQSLLQDTPQRQTTPLSNLYGSTRGRRDEIYEPRTSITMTVDESEDTMHSPRMCVVEGDAAEQRHLGSDDDGDHETNNKTIDQAESSHSAAVVPPTRLLRTRPVINYKKYF